MEAYENTLFKSLMKIILATHNAHKAIEIKTILEPIGFKVLTLNDLNFSSEIVETGNTLEENAQIKALTIASLFEEMVLADDSGLEVVALNGAPGVYSARYAGEPSNSNKNIELLLSNLKNAENRNAQFKTVLVLAQGSRIIAEFSGIVKGMITHVSSGKDGFGYDPVFKPEGYQQTFAEMKAEKKNKISHRALALEQFLNWAKHNLK